jgi:hypothetical protein
MNRIFKLPDSGRLPVHIERPENESSSHGESAAVEDSNGKCSQSAARTLRLNEHAGDKAPAAAQQGGMCGRCSWRLALWVLIPTLVVPMLVVAGLAIAKGTYDSRRHAMAVNPAAAAAEAAAAAQRMVFEVTYASSTSNPVQSCSLWFGSKKVRQAGWQGRH